MKFSIGQRVKISPEYNWAQNALGTITYPPKFAIELVKHEAPWEGGHRVVKGRTELIEFYWVEFDDPQLDPDGDGPYSASEIEADMIMAL